MDLTQGQPDKRSAAFENIFGRQKVIQSQPAAIPVYDATQYYQATPVAAAPVTPQRISYPGSLPPGTAYIQSPPQQLYALPQGAAPGPSPYRTSYYPFTAVQTQQLAPQQHTYYQHHLTPQHTAQVPVQRRSPSPYTRAPPGGGGSTIHPHPGQEPPDAGLEQHFTRQGLTPAQAYQAQVYLNSPASHPHQQPYPVVSAQDYSQLTPNPNHHHQHHHAAAARTPYNATPPQLPDVDLNIGGLGLSDFSKSTPEEDLNDGASSSELPWAQEPSPHANGNSRHLRSASSSISRRSMKRDSEPISLNSQSTGGPSYGMGRSSSPSISAEPQSPTSSTNPRRSGDSPRSAHLHHHHSQSVGRRSGAGLSERTSGPDRARSLSTPKAISMAEFSGGSPGPSGSRHGAITPMSQITATPPRPGHHHSNSHSRRTPIVYPAMLSRVAEAFRARITLAERVKDGLAYPDAFDGREA
ncbi:RHO1 GDP-GTP exchange protein 2, partial [Tulasnella sp. 408]